MSDETHRVPWSGGDRARAGAALAAPTSPHATPPGPDEPKRRATGPERFWASRRVRAALAVCFALSVVAHYAVSPWSFLPGVALEFKDTEGELTIPIELLEGPTEPAPAPPPPAPLPASPPAEIAKEGPGHAGVDASAPKPRRDAGAPRDAGSDAGKDAEAEDAGIADAMIAGGGGGDDAGLAEGIVAGPTLVEIRMNVAVVRTNSVGARLGPLLLGIPQWSEFMGGTDVDPIKDLDWIWIFGPSLLHTEKDAAILRYNMSDARAAKNIAVLSKHDVNGGAYDAGVPGVRAWKAHADNAWRVFLLPRPHLAAMVPPDFARVAARAFSRVEPRLRIGADEAVRIMVKNPNHPMPFLPASLTELRLWAVPRADGGADAYVECDAPDDAAAQVAARQIRQLASQMNSIGVKIVTHGLLNDLEVTSEGSLVKIHGPASADQLEAAYDLVAAYLGVNATPSGSATAAPTSVPQPRLFKGVPVGQ